MEHPAVERRSRHGGDGKLGGRTLCVVRGTGLEDEPPAFVPVFHVRSVPLALSGRSVGVVRPPCPREELYSPLGISTGAGLCLSSSFSVLVAGGSAQTGAVQQLLFQIKMLFELQCIDGSNCSLAAWCCLCPAPVCPYIA